MQMSVRVCEKGVYVRERVCIRVNGCVCMCEDSHRNGDGDGDGDGNGKENGRRR